MDYYATTVQRSDDTTHTVEILADSVQDAYSRAKAFYADAQRILIAVPDQTIHDRIKDAVFGLDTPDDAA